MDCSTKNSNPGKEGEADQPAPINEVTGKNDEESMVLDSQSQSNVQACSSTDHSADELPPCPESQKTAVADKAEEDNQKNPSCFDAKVINTLYGVRLALEISVLLSSL